VPAPVPLRLSIFAVSTTTRGMPALINVGPIVASTNTWPLVPVRGVHVRQLGR
jgi:hypothetical protein